MSKKILLVTLFILAIGGFGYYAYFINPGMFGSTKIEGKLDIKQFNGSIRSIEGDTVRMYGSFYVGTSTLPTEYAGPREFSFKVNNETKFEKLSVTMPSPKELMKNGATSGSFSLSDLPQTRSEGTFSDMNEVFTNDSGDTIIEVNFIESVEGVNNPTASFVLYNHLIRTVN